MRTAHSKLCLLPEGTGILEYNDFYNIIVILKWGGGAKVHFLHYILSSLLGMQSPTCCS